MDDEDQKILRILDKYHDFQQLDTKLGYSECQLCGLVIARQQDYEECPFETVRYVMEC